MKVYDANGIEKPGVAGATGAAGPTGPPIFLVAEDGETPVPFPGPKGQDGNAGATGSQGPIGPAIFLLDSGEDGEPGIPGVRGLDGLTGTTGGIGPVGPAVFLLAEQGDEGQIGPPGPPLDLQVSTASRLLGRGSIGGGGPVQELSVVDGLVITGTDLGIQTASVDPAVLTDFTRNTVLGRRALTDGPPEFLNLGPGLIASPGSLTLQAFPFLPGESESGEDGPPGPRGQDGTIGINGTQGSPGPAIFLLGEQGEEGEPGPPGRNGTSGAGGGAFTDLSDVPASYSGQALLAVRVNAAETGLEFAAGGGGVSLGLVVATAAGMNLP